MVKQFNSCPYCDFIPIEKVIYDILGVFFKESKYRK